MRPEPSQSKADQRFDAQADAPRVVAERLAERHEHVAQNVRVDGRFRHRFLLHLIDADLRLQHRDELALVAQLELAFVGDEVRALDARDVR